MAARKPPWKKPDTTALRSQLSHLLEAGAHDSLLDAVMGLVEQMTSQNDKLTSKLQSALSQLYRRKSEKISPDQLSLFLSRLSPEQASQAEVETTATQSQGTADTTSN